MSHTASHGSASRVPVYRGEERITGLWVRQKADGTSVYETQKRVDGRVRLIVHRAATTKTEAIVAHQRLTLGIEDGEVTIGDRHLTVAAVVEDFLGRESGVLASRKPRTVALYEQRLRLHVVPVLGTKKVGDLRVQHVRALIDGLTAKGRSGSMIRGTVTALSAALQHGERHLGSGRNVVRDLGRGHLPSGRRHTEPRYLSVPEVESLLATMTNESRPVASACFWGGLRISEALALRWEHVDVDAATIAVPGTKTETASATIPLLPALSRELRAHRERQATIGIHRIASGALVFQTASGRPVHGRNLLRAVKAASVNAGLVTEGQERVGCHDLRHSLAANAFALGLAPTEVARLLRHANPGIALAVYAGIADDAVAAIGGKLAASGFGA